MDHGFIGARMPAGVVDTAVAVYPVARNSGAGDPDDDNGVRAAMDGAAPARSESAENDDVYAGGVQPDFREYAGRADAVLFFVEPAGRGPAVHTKPRVQTTTDTRSDMSSSDSIETSAATIDQA